MDQRDLEGIRCGILTASDKGARGEREDVGGSLIRGRLEARGARVEAYQIVPDAQFQIASTLSRFADVERLDAVFTTGGTGLSPRDVTPQATLAIIDFQVPGIAEAMRQVGRAKTPFAALSRQVVGVRGHTLIVNLPGSPKAVGEGLDVVLPVLAHAVSTLHGVVGDHARE